MTCCSLIYQFNFPTLLILTAQPDIDCALFPDKSRAWVGISTVFDIVMLFLMATTKCLSAFLFVWVIASCYILLNSSMAMFPEKIYFEITPCQAVYLTGFCFRVVGIHVRACRVVMGFCWGFWLVFFSLPSTENMTLIEFPFVIAATWPCLVLSSFKAVLSGTQSYSFDFDISCICLPDLSSAWHMSNFPLLWVSLRTCKYSVPAIWFHFGLSWRLFHLGTLHICSLKSKP